MIQVVISNKIHQYNTLAYNNTQTQTDTDDQYNQNIQKVIKLFYYNHPGNKVRVEKLCVASRLWQNWLKIQDWVHYLRLEKEESRFAAKDWGGF